MKTAVEYYKVFLENKNSIFVHVDIIRQIQSDAIDELVKKCGQECNCRMSTKMIDFEDITIIADKLKKELE